MADMIYTIGHSNRDIDEFLGLLTMAGIEAVADVRTYPSSRRHPWFNRGNLSEALEERGLQYRHMTAIGGMRDRPEPDPSFQGVPEKWQPYAAHVQTDTFAEGLDRLLVYADRHGPVACMCAERDPERCHRQFIADALVLLRDREVEHLIRSGDSRAHEPREEAEVGEAGYLIYPSDQQPLPF